MQPTLSIAKATSPGSDTRFWVSAASLRNFVLDDPILDWLDSFGSARGFERDDQRPEYDQRTDFRRFVSGQAQRFQRAVLGHFGERYPVCEITAERQPRPGFAAAEETLTRMQAGAEIIYRGVLVDPEAATYGEPHLLIRSDVLSQLFPEALEPEEATVPAPALGAVGWHYRALDIKLGTLRLSGRGELRDQGSGRASRTQIRSTT